MVWKTLAESVARLLRERTATVRRDIEKFVHSTDFQIPQTKWRIQTSLHL